LAQQAFEVMRELLAEAAAANTTRSYAAASPLLGRLAPSPIR
jgi:hypothetical protein